MISNLKEMFLNVNYQYTATFYVLLLNGLLSENDRIISVIPVAYQIKIASIDNQWLTSNGLSAESKTSSKRASVNASRSAFEDLKSSKGVNSFHNYRHISANSM